MLKNDFFLKRYGVDVRLVDTEDAEFIVNLRTDARLSQYIHKTSNDVERQKEWLRDYKKRESAGSEYYFIFGYEGINYGVSRLYNILNKDFTSGSWLFTPASPIGLSVLSSIIAKEIAYELLGLEHDYADIRKGNKQVIRFNLSFEPVIIKEDEENIYLRFDRAKFNKNKIQHIEICRGILRS